MGSNINETPKKAHTWAERRNMTYRCSKSVHRCDLCAWRRDQKRKKVRQRKKPNSDKLAIRRDHQRRRIKMRFCMVGGLREIVLRFKFHQNRLSGFGAVGIEICPSPLTWPLAYTTACTTVQAVINSVSRVRLLVLLFVPTTIAVIHCHVTVYGD